MEKGQEVKKTEKIFFLEIYVCQGTVVLGVNTQLVFSIYLDEEGRGFESRRCQYKIVFLLWN